MSDEIPFVDTEGFSSKNEGLSIEAIILIHLHKLSAYASKEMTGGYWQKKLIPVGNTLINTEEYIPDRKETYSNAVLHLRNLLLPFFDKEMQSANEKYEEKIKTIHKALTNSDDLFTDWKSKESETKYKNSKYFLCFQLFQDLNLFLNRNGYLKSKNLEVGD